jgi:hypothetical protein
MRKYFPLLEGLERVLGYAIRFGYRLAHPVRVRLEDIFVLEFVSPRRADEIAVGLQQAAPGHLPSEIRNA